MENIDQNQLTTEKISYLSKLKKLIFGNKLYIFLAIIVIIGIVWLYFFIKDIYKVENKKCDDPSLVRNSEGLCYPPVQCKQDEEKNEIGNCMCKKGTKKVDDGYCCLQENISIDNATGKSKCCNQVCGTTCCSPGQVCQNGECLSVCGKKTENGKTQYNFCKKDEKCVVVTGMSLENLKTFEDNSKGKNYIVEKEKDTNLTILHICENLNATCSVTNEKSVPAQIENFSPCFKLQHITKETTGNIANIGWCTGKEIKDKTFCYGFKKNSECIANQKCEWYNLLENSTKKTTEQVISDINDFDEHKLGFFCKNDNSNNYYRILRRVQQSNLTELNNCGVNDCISNFSRSVGIIDIHYNFNTGVCSALQSCSADDKKFYLFSIKRYISENEVIKKQESPIIKELDINLKSCNSIELPNLCNKENSLYSCDKRNGLISTRKKTIYKYENLEAESEKAGKCREIEVDYAQNSDDEYPTLFECITRNENKFCTEGFEMKKIKPNPMSIDDYACFQKMPRFQQRTVNSRNKPKLYDNQLFTLRYGGSYGQAVYACSHYGCTWKDKDFEDKLKPSKKSTLKHYVFLVDKDYKNDKRRWINYHDEEFKKRFCNSEDNCDCSGLIGGHDENINDVCIEISKDEKDIMNRRLNLYTGKDGSSDSDLWNTEELYYRI